MDNKNSSILATEKAARKDKFSSEDSKENSSKNKKKDNVSFLQKTKNIFKNIINYPTKALISIYIIFHSGYSLAHLFGMDNLSIAPRYDRFSEYIEGDFSEEGGLAGFLLAFFLFLVYKFYFGYELKKILNYSLIFNLIFMILYLYFHAVNLDG